MQIDVFPYTRTITNIYKISTWNNIFSIGFNFSSLFICNMYRFNDIAEGRKIEKLSSFKLWNDRITQRLVLTITSLYKWKIHNTKTRYQYVPYSQMKYFTCTGIQISVHYIAILGSLFHLLQARCLFSLPLFSFTFPRAFNISK